MAINEVILYLLIDLWSNDFGGIGGVAGVEEGPPYHAQHVPSA